MTFRCDARTAARAFTILTVILCLGENLQAQWGYQAKNRTDPTVVARLTPRQQRNLIKYNEAGAIRSLQTLLSAEATYQATTGNGEYGTIEELGKVQLIDRVLAEGHRYGYLFRVGREKNSSESQASFHVAAVPRTYGRSGRRSFYIDETGAIRAADKNGAEASPSDFSLVIDP
ncbi:MAG: hypothetical protein ABJC10_08960 [Acidobacteriota bacterium]